MYPTPTANIDPNRLRKLCADADSAYEATQAANVRRKSTRLALQDAEAALAVVVEFIKKGGRPVNHARSSEELDRQSSSAARADAHRLAVAQQHRDDAAAAHDMASANYHDAQKKQGSTRRLADACRELAASKGALPSDMGGTRTFTAAI